MARVKTWFDDERVHGHEVRKRTILTRLKYELEYETDRQMVEHIASSAGDKYRVTLINISGVEHWFDPSSIE